MKEISEPARVTPVVAETDVLVVGSEPGGLAAAISAARAGVETMIVERYGCFGGNLTHVGVEGIAWYRQKGTVDVEGIGIEFEERAKRFGSSGPEPQSLSHAINGEPFDQARATGVIPSGLKSIGGTWSLINDRGEATYLNMVHMLQYDGTDVNDLTSGEIEGRRQALLAIKALQHFAPGFETATLRNFGMTIGIRDTRKIIGRYCLTEEDVRGQARFDDAIGIFPEFIDGYGVLVLPTTGRYYHVPYGALVASGGDNLLVAGRSVAGDQISHASVRNMMCCTVTGQGAGVAAAVSVKKGVSTAVVPIEDIQRELKRQGVRFV